MKEKQAQKVLKSIEAAALWATSIGSKAYCLLNALALGE